MPPTDATQIAELARLVGLPVPVGPTSHVERWPIYQAALDRRDLDDEVLQLLAHEADGPLQSAVVIHASHLDPAESRRAWIAHLAHPRDRDHDERWLREAQVPQALRGPEPASSRLDALAR